MEPSAEIGRYALPAIMDLSAAEGVQQALVASLRESKNGIVEINGMAAERVSTACIQVLLVAKASFESDGGRLKLVSPSDSLSSAFNALGLGHQLVELCAG